MPLTYRPVPYWFDGSNGEVSPIEIDGRSAVPFDHLVATLGAGGSVSVMAYRNRADGDGGIVDLVGHEVGQHRVPVMIGVETTDIDPPTATFAGSTLAELRTEARVGGGRDRGRRRSSSTTSRVYAVSPIRPRHRPTERRRTIRGFTREEIIATHFGSVSRRGYDPMAVDEYLEHVAEYVGWLRNELARHQGNEGAALELLRNAQRVADEKLMAAALGADERRAAAESELLAARSEAGRLLGALGPTATKWSRRHRDPGCWSSRRRAGSVWARSRLLLVGVLLKGHGTAWWPMRSHCVSDTAIDLRTGGNRLQAMADQFQFDLTARSESFDVGDDAFVGPDPRDG